VSDWHWIALAVYVVGFFLTPHAMADRWDALQCPSGWTIRALQEEFAI